MMNSIDGIKRLREGNERFVNGKSQHAATTLREDLSHGQSPFAVVLACSDSRVPVEMVFDQGFGDLFVIRVAGNIVAPSQIGSVEFAVTQFGTTLAVVLGHSSCGVIQATLDELSLDTRHRSPNLRAIVDRVRPSVEPVLESFHGEVNAASKKQATEANVRASVEHLRHGSLLLEQLIDKGELTVIGANYSLASGTVDFLGD
jgi:carbonic anhydrase